MRVISDKHHMTLFLHFIAACPLSHKLIYFVGLFAYVAASWNANRAAQVCEDLLNLHKIPVLQLVVLDVVVSDFKKECSCVAYAEWV